MTGEELRDWQVRCGYRTDAPAAKALGKSITTYRRMIKNRVRISDTIKILTCCIELQTADFIRVAAAAYHLQAHTRTTTITPAAAAAVVDLVAGAPSMIGFRR